MTLNEIKPGKQAIIRKIDLSNPVSIRLIELGFTPGQKIEILHGAVFNDPLAVALRGTTVALRKKDASCIEVDA